MTSDPGLKKHVGLHGGPKKYNFCNNFVYCQPIFMTVALFCDSRRFRRQIVAEIGDYSRQCGQAFIRAKPGAEPA